MCSERNILGLGLGANSNSRTQHLLNSNIRCTNDLMQIVRQAPLIFVITFEATCYIKIKAAIINRSTPQRY